MLENAEGGEEKSRKLKSKCTYSAPLSLPGRWTENTSLCVQYFSRVAPLHRENRENGQKSFPVWENSGNLEMLPGHLGNKRNYIC